MKWKIQAIIFVLLFILASGCSKAGYRNFSNAESSAPSLWVLCHRGETIASVDVKTWKTTTKISMPALQLASDLFVLNNEVCFTQFGDIGVYGDSLICLEMNTNNERSIRLSQAPFGVGISKDLMRAVVSHTALWDDGQTMVSFVDLSEHKPIRQEYVKGLATSVQVAGDKAYVVVIALTDDQENKIIIYDLKTTNRIKSLPLTKGRMALGTDFAVENGKYVYYSIYQENDEGVPISAQVIKLDLQSGNETLLATLPMAGDIALTEDKNIIVSPGLYGHAEPVRLISSADGRILQERVFAETANNITPLNDDLFAITLEESNEIAIFDGRNLDIQRKIAAPCGPFILEMFFEDEE